MGLAGIVSAAAVGVAVGASAVQRRRREFVDATPDELAQRLHERLAEAKARQSD